MNGLMHCPCCQRDNAIPARVKAPDGLPSRAVVCGLCSRHQGSDTIDRKRADTAHIEMWREDLREAVEGTTEHFQKMIDEMRAELDGRPVSVRVVNEDLDEMNRLRAEIDRLFRSRNRVVDIMADLHEHHRELSNGKCSCGRKIEHCKEAALFDQCGPLKAWERSRRGRDFDPWEDEGR